LFAAFYAALLAEFEVFFFVVVEGFRGFFAEFALFVASGFSA
jgi:hypothetical protein